MITLSERGAKTLLVHLAVGSCALAGGVCPAGLYGPTALGGYALRGWEDRIGVWRPYRKWGAKTPVLTPYIYFSRARVQ